MPSSKISEHTQQPCCFGGGLVTSWAEVASAVDQRWIGRQCRLNRVGEHLIEASRC